MHWTPYSESALEVFRERLSAPAQGTIRIIASGPRFKFHTAYVNRGPGGRIRLAVDGYGWDGVEVTHFFEPTDPNAEKA